MKTSIKHISSLVIALTALLVLVPGYASAADQVDRHTERLSSDVTLFQIHFPLTAMKNDIYVPALLKRDVPNGARDGVIGYSFHKQSAGAAATKDGMAVGIVLAENAERVGDAYRIKAGTNAWFDVIVLATASEKEGGLYRLRIDEIPFFIDRDGTRDPQHLNPTELAGLRTSYREINFTRPREED